MAYHLDGPSPTPVNTVVCIDAQVDTSLTFWSYAFTPPLHTVHFSFHCASNFDLDQSWTGTRCRSRIQRVQLQLLFYSLPLQCTVPPCARSASIFFLCLHIPKISRGALSTLSTLETSQLSAVIRCHTFEVR